ncbi:uncharacterized protein LOC104440612 isoform X1 [Eucalyptus grandis]|uniref:uncharacterized protein LOC104440612 isoform X1 n=1 Tax=Eucalyptus grandis TaxID=71139 RepID=UPI00192EA0B6|nr:uncharacterized protein LOC104440612 isoform X1 [Eucalyptus grandis]
MEIVAPKANAGSRPRVRAPAGAGSRSSRSSGARSAPVMNPRSGQEIWSRKRVRLADHCEDNCLGVREDEAITQEGADVRLSDVPKTSEYAFFKKLKENKGHRFSSRSMQNKATPATKFIADHNPSTSTHVVDSVHKESGSSLLHQDVMPNNFASLQSPIGSVSRKSGTSYMYKCGEVFTKKRENLLLWVKTTSFPEIDELCSKGYGFVSVLLSRLNPMSSEDNVNPMSNEDNDATNLDRKQFDSSMSSKLRAYPQSGIQLKEFNHNCTWDFLEAEGGQYLDCSLSSGWLKNSMERIPDYIPAVAAFKTVTWQESEDEFQAPNKSLIEEETRDSDGQWVLNNKNNERDLCFVCQSRELTTAPALLTYQCNDCQQTLESRFGGRELSAFSVSSHYPSKFCPLLCHPTSFHNDDLETHYDPQTLQSGIVRSELSASFAPSHYPSQYWPSQCQSMSFHNNDLETCYGQQTLESGFGGRESPAFSVSSHYPLQSCPSKIPSTSFHNHDYGTQYNRKEDIAIFNDLPCSLSHNLYNSRQAEDHDFDDLYAVLSPSELDQFINKGFSERHDHPLTDGLMLSLECDSDLRLICFSSPISSLGNHIFTDYTHQSPQDGEVLLSFLCGEDWYKRLKSSIQMDVFSGFSRSSFTQILDREKTYPLLPDNSSSDEGEVIVHGSKICNFDASWQF